ncbi:AAA family ATPase [Paracoccus siganidrum]|uniref:Guanylate cyclase n=1 Tax=Paracoccus siganidrum TaxID=1276757 RepID=A0A419ACA3_9RHOB|nr:AAA family ATPase [Paracoccus siganidrum]RJL21813.1 guanylate cyclase [Paracoccus siganidrum]RMC38176.1 guanylate cyclase [Paracoccus siganidrum]
MSQEPGWSVGDWLAEQGLGQYAEAFRQADIDFEVLHHLSDEDLVSLGVTSLGHRRRIRARLARIEAQEGIDLTAAELRYLTVLFCDLVDSTRLANRLSAEAFSELLGAFYRSVEQATEPYGGHVAQYHGDGVLIYFGYPNPVEDAALHAVLAARDAIGGVARLDIPQAGRVLARGGVASGLVVVDGQRSGWNASPGRAFGATVNLAARVQAEAAPNSVALADSTAQLLRGQVGLVPMGSRQLKGIDLPCRLYTLRPGETPQAAPDAPQPQRAPLAGRAAEIARLARCWDRVGAGGTGLALVTGEAGLGKSRLVDEFVTRIEEQGGPVRRLACRSHGQETPFHALLPLLRFGQQAGDAEAARILAQIASGGEQHPAMRRQRRKQIVEALARHVAGGPQGPRIVWFDDLHWADPSTVDTLLALVAQNHPGLLVIVSSRSLEHCPGLGADLPPDGATRIALAPLGRGDTGRIIREILDRLPVGEELIERLASRAEGIPIFAEELALSLRERLADLNLPGQIDEAMGAIPSSLQQILQARIQRLPVARPLVLLLATAGGAAPVPLLRELWQQGSPIEPALDELVASGLAELKLSRRQGQEDMLVLRHQIIADFAYEMILTRDRRRLHSTIADALARRAVRGLPVEKTAQAEQYARAGRAREAAEIWAEAGRIAAAQSAEAEAVTLFRKALDLLPQVQDAEWAQVFEADTLLSLYRAMVSAEGYHATSPEQMAQLQSRIAGVGGSQRVFASAFLQWMQLCSHGEIDTAHAFGLGLEELARADDSGLFRMVLDRMLGSSLMFRGELDQARARLQAFLDRYDPALHDEPLREFGVTNNYVTVLCCMASIEALTGSDASTRAAVGRVLAAVDALNHHHTTFHSLIFGAALPCGIRGDIEMLDMVLARLDRMMQDHPHDLWGLLAQLAGAIRLAGRGQGAEAARLFDEAEAALRNFGFVFMSPTLRAVMVLARARAGEMPPDPAEMQALAAALKAGERWMLPPLHALCDVAGHGCCPRC